MNLSAMTETAESYCLKPVKITRRYHMPGPHRFMIVIVVVVIMCTPHLYTIACHNFIMIVFPVSHFLALTSLSCAKFYFVEETSGDGAL